MIEIQNLLYEVEGKILFENASLIIEKGRYHLLGNNGVGKTTLFNLLTNNLKPQEGSIQIDKDFVYINQFPLLLENVSIKNNILFFNKNKKKDIIKKLIECKIDTNKKVKSLSGGQKQLVYLLINLISDYNLYLIDEPFNNLDQNRISLVKDLIDEKNNVIIIDHLNTYNYKNIKIENRGLICDI